MHTMSTAEKTTSSADTSSPPNTTADPNSPSTPPNPITLTPPYSSPPQQPTLTPPPIPSPLRQHSQNHTHTQPLLTHASGQSSASSTYSSTPSGSPQNHTRPRPTHPPPNVNIVTHPNPLSIPPLPPPTSQSHRQSTAHASNNLPPRHQPPIITSYPFSPPAIHQTFTEPNYSNQSTPNHPDTPSPPTTTPSPRDTLPPSCNLAATSTPITQLHNAPPTYEPLTICTPAHFHRLAHKTDNQVFCLTISPISTTKPLDIPTPPTTNPFLQFARNNFPQLFPESLPHYIPPHDRIHHYIDLTPNHTIPKRKLYRQTHDELLEIKRQLTEYIHSGQISPTTSPFGAPILLVKKKDGTMRMCVDYRGLNDITIKNTFPIPRIDDLHDRLAHATIFTKLDLFSGYHQIPVHPPDRHKTAFITRYGTYEFNVMPFGLSNAPATFQTAMNTLFYDLLDNSVIVYLDDILIYSTNPREHYKHLHDVFTRLAHNQWYCKLAKCSFGQPSIEYLGHIITKGTLHIDPDKMKAITQWPTPFHYHQRNTEFSRPHWILSQIH